ncbi:MAG: hypothetical protein Q9217_005263 [Psora testacea]
MGKKRKQLSQAEIWDDSSLLQTWEDALEEYKLYHSIHAKGERVEDVIKSAEREEESVHSMTNGGGDNVAGKEAIEGIGEELEDGELEEEIKDVGEEATSERPAPSFGHVPSTATNDPAPSMATPSLPTLTVNGVSDEGLRRLMMSWYWAGYYTGLFEGQQQATKNTIDGD